MTRHDRADVCRHLSPRRAAAERRCTARFCRRLEIDTRMLGMVGGAGGRSGSAFDILSGGVFLTPRNLWNLSVQTASVAIMATGMVLVIVTRNIDLSVGSILGFVGMSSASLQVRVAAGYLGFEHRLTATWIVVAGRRHGDRRAIGAVPGLARSPISASPPSSSRSAACWSGAARPGGSRRPDRRADGHDASRLFGGGAGRLDRRDRELGRRRRRLRRRSSSARHRAPSPRQAVRLPAAAGLGGCGHRGRRAAARCSRAAAIANAYPLPAGIARRCARGERHRVARRRAVHPARHRACRC